MLHHPQVVALTNGLSAAINASSGLTCHPVNGNYSNMSLNFALQHILMHGGGGMGERVYLAPIIIGDPILPGSSKEDILSQLPPGHLAFTLAWDQGDAHEGLSTQPRNLHPVFISRPMVSHRLNEFPDAP